MSTHPYEYKVLTEYIAPDEKGRYPHFNHIEDKDVLQKPCRKYSISYQILYPRDGR